MKIYVKVHRQKRRRKNLQPTTNYFEIYLSLHTYDSFFPSPITTIKTTKAKERNCNIQRLIYIPRSFGLE